MQEDYESAISDCDAAVALCPTYHKAYYRRAVCCEQNEQNWDKALDDYKMVLTYEPNNHKALQALVVGCSICLLLFDLLNANYL